MSFTTTTQKLQAAHARYPIIVTIMPVTADKRYDDAAIIEPENTFFAA
ncbi:hypothetical protein [uncultured Nostoc sp.]